MTIRISGMGMGGVVRSSGPGGSIKFQSSGGGGPSVVMSDLALYLDASNPSSYPGSGVTWYDLSGNSKHATLINSPTYSPTNGGIIAFDRPSGQYATGPALGGLNDWTICMWVRPDENDSSYNNSEQFFTDETGVGGNGLVNYCLGHLYSSTGVSVNSYNYNWSGTYTTPYTPTLGNFYFFVGIKDSSGFRLYSNDVLVASSPTGNGSGLNGLQGYRIASKWTAYDPAVYISMATGFVAFYSRALTDNERTQNWDATRGRYGL